MIGYWVASRSPHYHPSVACVAQSPHGRAVAPARYSFALENKVANARRAVSVFNFLPVIPLLAVCFIGLILSGSTSETVWILAMFGPFVGFMIFGNLDRVFWIIRRAHDIGKSWIWVGIPALLIVFTPIGIAFCLTQLSGEMAFGLMAGYLIFVLLPAGLVLLWITFGQSEVGENRYGPPAEAIPDYWFD